MTFRIRLPLKLTQAKKRLLLILPFLCSPFLAVIFWAMKSGTSAQQASTASHGGLMQLPSTDLNRDREMSKLDHYRKSEKDSAEHYNQWEPLMDNWTEQIDGLYPVSEHANGMHEQGPDYEKQLYLKLAELDRSLHEVSDFDAPSGSSTAAQRIETPLEVDGPKSMARPARATPLYHSNSTLETEPDPEIQQLNTMLDKIIQIQGPQEASNASSSEIELTQQHHLEREASSRGTLLQERMQDSSLTSGFYSSVFSADMAAHNAVTAVIHENQVVGNGSVLKMRLLEDYHAGSVNVPKGTFVYGAVQLNGERMKIRVGNINVNGRIVNTKLEVYDIDGIQGIYVPEMLDREVIIRSADQSVQSIGIGQNISSALISEATSAGIQAAKSLFSKRARRIRIELKSDYRLLLKDLSIVK
ncbi:conjugative transposon protein TraM [Sphingobacterium sp. UBA6645]|uniref:conjugative transposon protein TraM n=1 Tax=Sphingobacterium sp. UBA6645 TaxID=1947511 RepID=UPI0025E41B4A|nr:conjugative transposon protein TraM [Sphingobacterium sp. UBA6645]